MGRRQLTWLLFACLPLGLQTGCKGVSDQGDLIAQMGKPGSVEGTPAQREPQELPPLETAKVCLATADKLFKAGQDADALLLYEKARTADPSLKHVCRRMAILYDRQGAHEKAQEEYQKALALMPTDPDLRNDIGYSAYARGRWTEAEQSFRQALEVNPHHQRARINLGLVLAQQRRYEESLAAFCAAVPEAQAHSNLAFIYCAQGQRTKSIEEYHKALQLDPDLTVARAALARLEHPEKFAPKTAQSKTKKSKPTMATQTATTPNSAPVVGRTPTALQSTSLAQSPGLPGSTEQSSNTPIAGDRRIPPLPTRLPAERPSAKPSAAALNPPVPIPDANR